MMKRGPPVTEKKGEGSKTISVTPWMDFKGICGVVQMGQKRKTDIISCKEAQTLSGLFAIRVKRTPRSIAYRQFDAESGKWREYSWQEIDGRVARWKRALMREKLEPGDRIAILLRNSIEWVCFDQAALAIGLAVVPLYPSDAPDNIAYILEDSGTRLLLVGTQKRWEMLAPRCKHLTGLGKILCVEHPTADGSEGRMLQGVNEWLKEADEQASDQEDRSNSGSKGKFPASDPHALATLVYTSGTTGNPNPRKCLETSVLSGPPPLTASRSLPPNAANALSATSWRKIDQATRCHSRSFPCPCKTVKRSQPSATVQSNNNLATRPLSCTC